MRALFFGIRMNVVNVNIPPWFPNQPYLSLPLLTGILRKEGFSVYQKDINLSFYDNLLSEEEIQYQVNTLTKSKIDEIDPKQKLLLDLKNFFVENVEKIKWETRQKESFNAKDYANNLFQDLDLILKLYTISFPEIELSLGEIKYHFDYLNPDIISSFLESESNIFKYYFSKYELHDILNQHPDIVAIGVTTPEQLIPALSLASLLKANADGLEILLGGDYISRVFNTIIQHDILGELVDFVIVGNAEKAIVNFCSAKENYGDLHTVKSLVWKNEKGFICNPIESSFTYSCLKFPDFDGLHLSDYFFPEVYLPIEISKGCYWGKCSFCEIKGKPYFQKRASQIMEEMIQQNKKYGASYFAFVSSSPSPKLLLELSERIYDLGLKWSAFLRPESYIDENFAKILYNGGCRILYIGFESGSQRVLDAMHKGIDITKVESLLKNFKNAGIKIHGYFMFGFTGETEEDRKNTIDFINRNKGLFYSVSYSGYVEPYGSFKGEVNGLRIYKPSRKEFTYKKLLQNTCDEDNNRLYYINLNLEITYEN